MSDRARRLLNRGGLLPTVLTGLAAFGGAAAPDALAGTPANEGLSSDGTNEENETPLPGEGTESEAPPTGGGIDDTGDLGEPAPTPPPVAPTPPPIPPAPATPVPETAPPPPAPETTTPAPATPAPPQPLQAAEPVEASQADTPTEVINAPVPMRRAPATPAGLRTPQAQPPTQQPASLSVAPTRDVSAVPADPKPTASSPASGSHTVKPGQSLWSIAQQRLGRSASAGAIAAEVDRLWRLNSARIGTGDPSLLPAGVQLRLK